MLYDLTVRQINKAKTGEKLADLKNKVNVFFLVVFEQSYEIAMLKLNTASNSSLE